MIYTSAYTKNLAQNVKNYSQEKQIALPTTFVKYVEWCIGLVKKKNSDL